MISTLRRVNSHCLLSHLSCETSILSSSLYSHFGFILASCSLKHLRQSPFCNMEVIFTSPAGILQVIAQELTRVECTNLGLILCTVPRSAGGQVGAQNLLGLAELRSVIRQMAVVFGVWVGHVTEQADVQCRRLFDVSYISVKYRLNWWEHHFVCQAIKHQPMVPVDWIRMGKQWREIADIKGDEGVCALFDFPFQGTR